MNPLKVEPVSALPKPMVDQTATAPATTGGDLSGLQSNAMNIGQPDQMSGLTASQNALVSDPLEREYWRKKNLQQGIA